MPNKSITLFILQILIVALVSAIFGYKCSLPSKNSLIAQDVWDELAQEGEFKFIADNNLGRFDFEASSRYKRAKRGGRNHQTTEVRFQSIEGDIDCPEPYEYTISGEVLVYNEYRENVEYSWKDYAVKISRRDGKCHSQMSLTIYRSGDIVHSIKKDSAKGEYYGDFYVLGIKDGIDMSMGRDVTGNGKPNLVVQEWCGGNSRSGWDCYLFELGEEFKLLKTWKNSNYGDTALANADNENGYELVQQIVLWPYPYPGAMADFVTTKIFLKQYGEDYKAIKSNIIPIPMSADLATDEDIRADAENFRYERKIYEEDFRRYIFNIMADFICAGHAGMANKYFHHAWPLEVPGKEDFLTNLKEKLAESAYWPDIQRINDMKVWYPIESENFY